MNAFVAVPACLLVLTRVVTLAMSRNALLSVPSTIAQLSCLRELRLHRNRLSSLPSEIGRLRSLSWLTLEGNELVAVPAELGDLPLDALELSSNRLQWIPAELDRLPAKTTLHLFGNPLAVRFDYKNVRARLRELIAATTHIGMIRRRATEVCIGLQDLGLPAFVTLAILDALSPPNSIRMWAKWQLITIVKHHL